MKKLFVLVKFQNLTNYRNLSSQSNVHNKIKLVLYTKKNCTLCDEAKEEIQNLYPNRFHIEEVNIVKDRSLFRKFKFDIPVFFYNEKFLMQHKVDKKALVDLVKEYDSKLSK
jgi:hypothetical protein